MRFILPYFLFANVLSLLNKIKSQIRDLPNHCLNSQVSGVWKLELSDPVPVSSGHDMKCGHHEPDIDKDSWKSY